MAKLSFSNQTVHKLPTRTRPTKYATSPIRRELVQGDDGGMRPVGAYYPWKYLPVQFQDTETGDWLVILKGTIVSLLTNQVPAAAAADNLTGISGGIPDISASGTILVYNDATTAASTYSTANIDDSYWGYHDSAVGLLIPANGGTAGLMTYSADDVTAAVTKPDTTLVVENGDTVSIPATVPAGIVYADVYQDIRGANLSYDLWAAIYGILSDGLIFVPYIDAGDTTPQSMATFDNGIVSDYNVNTTNDAGYSNTHRKHAFFYFDSAQDSFAAQSGMLLTSDSYGKFIPQGARGSLSRTQAYTAQTVGRLLYTDARWPKDFMDTVDTYPSSGLQGSETGGVPAYIYNFAADAMGSSGMSLTASISAIVDQIQSGSIGSAAIQVDIS
jgi:hypothetical protein